MKMLGRGLCLGVGLCALGLACGSGDDGGGQPQPATPPPAKPPAVIPPVPPDPPPPPPPDPCPPPAQALTPADLDKQVGYHAAIISANACTTGDITTLETNSNDTTLKSFFDLGK